MFLGQEGGCAHLKCALGLFLNLCLKDHINFWAQTRVITSKQASYLFHYDSISNELLFYEVLQSSVKDTNAHCLDHTYCILIFGHKVKILYFSWVSSLFITWTPSIYLTSHHKAILKLIKLIHSFIFREPYNIGFRF